jgi:hypothetical protein
MSRGRTDDYRYLGSAPDPGPWQQFDRLTTFEQPSLLVHADSSGWHLYASAIPTARHDFRNTRIRISVELRGERETMTTEARNQVLCLVHEWLSGAQPGASAALVDAFDEQFPEDVVERMIARTGTLNDEDLTARVRRTLESGAPSNRGQMGTKRSDSWVGGDTNTTARAEFVHRVRALLDGATGWAVQLNMADVQDVQDLELTSPLAALVGVDIPEGLRHLHPKAWAPTPSPNHGQRRLVMVAVLTAAVVAVAVAGWLIVQRHVQQTPNPAPGCLSASTAGRATQSSPSPGPSSRRATC